MQTFNFSKVVTSRMAPFLKENGINQNVINMYVTLVKEFEYYSNEFSKHGIGKITCEELEFLIYTFGSLVRLIYNLDIKIV